MPVARFQMPDGRVARFEVPEGTTPEQAQAMIADAMPQKTGTGSRALDTGNAVGTGFWRGMSSLAGLPVDTAMNVVDLGKAALGAPYIALTGKEPPNWLQVGDRSKVVGSGSNIINSARKTAAGDVMLNPANPEYEGGYAQAAGAGLTGVIAPNNARQAINQAALGLMGAIGGKATYDATGNQALAITAGMMPLGAQLAATEGAKRMVRGGESGRLDMAKRITDLRNAGVEKPTLGLASGNQMLGGIENLLQSTPGAVGVMRRSRDGAVAGMQGMADDAAALASPNRGTMEAGTAIQRGVNGAFKDNFKATQGLLYDRLGNEIGGQFPTNVGNTERTLAALNSDIPGAPAMSQFFKNGRIQQLEGALRSDLSGAPQSVMVYRQPPKAGGGLMNQPVPQDPLQVVIPAYPARKTLPFEAVKKTRTMVGNEIADSTIVSDVPRSKWNPLYGALSDDMQGAAREAGGNAPQAFNRANNYSRAGMERMDRIAPFGQPAAPEQAFTMLERSARENVSTLQAVKKSLPQDARGSVAGTIIERLGKARPGQQNADSTAWSPETFLTNWNNMTPKARQELFSGFKNSREVAANVESIARGAAMMRENSKLWANPSGSGANLAARGMLGLLGLGGGASLAGMVNPLVPLGIGGSMGGANLAARALTNPFIVTEMAKRTNVSPQLLGAQLAPMAGLLSQ